MTQPESPSPREKSLAAAHPAVQGKIAQHIEAALRAAFRVSALVVEDESAQHQGHVGSRPEGETHFHIHLVSPDFAGLSRIERHRRIHAALGPHLLGRIHALRLTLAADERGSRAG